MNIKNGNRPAMPQSMAMNDNEGYSLPDFQGDFDYSGLTKREHFAAMAMQALVTSEPHWEAMSYITPDVDGMAKEAVLRADALLKALEESK